jgi:hypothetical protein
MYCRNRKIRYEGNIAISENIVADILGTPEANNPLKPSAKNREFTLRYSEASLSVRISANANASPAISRK